MQRGDRGEKCTWARGGGAANMAPGADVDTLHSVLCLQPVLLLPTQSGYKLDMLEEVFSIMESQPPPPSCTVPQCRPAAG